VRSLRSWQIVLGVGLLAALAIGIAALVLWAQAPGVSMIALYSNVEQHLDTADTWTDIMFQSRLHHQSDDWSHARNDSIVLYSVGTGASRHFMVYLSVQAGLDTQAPTAAPTTAPTTAPTAAPTVTPTEAPTAAPTVAPTPPTASPTAAPTVTPTPAPTAAPTPPTPAPTAAPTVAPTPPTPAPTTAPTVAPTPPTKAPTQAPTTAPTPAPTTAPTTAPTEAPTEAPTPPTEAPTFRPVVCDSPAYYIRAVVLHADGSSFVEVAGSRTWVTHNTFLSKSFEMDARNGDEFKFQWMSPCVYLTLTPVPIDNPLLGALNWHADGPQPTDVSATLIITNA
jgi:hypothetical protein